MTGSTYISPAKIYVNRLDYQVLNNNAYLNTQILYIKHIRIDTRSKKTQARINQHELMHANVTFYVGSLYVLSTFILMSYLQNNSTSSAPLQVRTEKKLLHA